MSCTPLLATPWARPAGLYSAPGQLLLKLELGEAPEQIPAAWDVRRGTAAAATRIDGGPLDRTVHHFSQHLQITRVHTAATGLGGLGSGHLGFDDIEQATGLARTFRLQTAPCCCLADLIDALRQLAVVESVSPQYLVAVPLAAPAVALEDDSWAHQRLVRAAEAMAYEPGDPAVIVGIVDTGVCARHPELQSRLRPGFDAVQLGSQDLASGIELLGDRDIPDPEPDDEVGHGTSCTGIIGATGTGMPPGLAGSCGLLAIRSLGSARLPGRQQVVGIGSLADIDAGTKTAIDLGATVLNLSFGTAASALTPDDPEPHQDLVDYARRRQTVLVAASGNSGRTERYFPAAHDGVIAVGSVDSQGRPSSFSTRGRHVLLSAPGERVLSAGLDSYQRVTGTSFAAPFVTAAAALLVSRARRRSAALSSSDIAQILSDSARPWPAGAQVQGYGGGILDALSALELLDRRIDATREGPQRPQPKTQEGVRHGH